MPMPHADVALARRLEGADAWGNAQFVPTLARLFPEVDASALPAAGGYAIFAGVDSPLTQAIGLGMDGPVATAEVERMEAFYRSHGADVHIETCPLADPSLHAILTARGYRTEERSHVLARPLPAPELGAPAQSAVTVRVPSPEEAEMWARTVATGVVDGGHIAPSLLALFVTLAQLPSATCFLASLEGRPAGGGAVAVYRGVAALFAASTLPEFRRRGVQAALLQARLAFAVAAGCDIAMVMTEPESASQRNVERQGFRVMYTRTKVWRAASPLRDAHQAFQGGAP